MPGESTARGAAVFAAIVVVLAAASAVPGLLPPPVSDDGRVDRMLAAVESIASEPHPMGSEAIEEVRGEIVDRLAGLGYDADLQRIEATDYYAVGVEPVPVVNVAARLAGSDSTGAVALVAHYDTVPTTPGANDNTAAVAILLEVARELRSGPMLRNDVVLLFTDGEEPAPRFGSTAFVAEHPWAGDISVVVNLEAIGGSGASTPTAINGPQAWLVDQLREASPRPVAYSFLTDMVDLIGGSNTDLAPFRDRGIAGIEFAYLHGSSIYHTPGDALDSVGRRSLNHHAVTALSLVRRLGDSDLTELPAGADVFTTIGPGWVVRYPRWWTIPVVVGVGALVLWLLWRRRGESKGRGLIRAVGADLATAVIVATIGTVLWLGITALRSMPGVVEGYGYLMVLSGVAAAGVVVTRRRRTPGRSPGSDLDALRMALVWWFVAVSTVAVPGLSGLFLWPACVTAIVVGLGAGPSGSPVWVRMAGFTVVAFTAILLVVPATDVFFQFAVPRPGNPDSQLLPMMAVPLLFVALTTQLLHSTWPGRTDQPPAIAPTTR